MSITINQSGMACPKCGHSDRTRFNTWADNWAEIYCDRCVQHFASEDYDEPFTPTETPRLDVRDLIVGQLLRGVTNSFEERDEEQPL
jgi:late competence protein required for DNA uptake (superfamily II DNA/RNA helicase)